MNNNLKLVINNVNDKKFDDKNFYAIKGGHYSPNTYKIISNEILKHLY